MSPLAPDAPSVRPETPHEYAEGTLKRLQHDVMARDAVITHLQHERAELIAAVRAYVDACREQGLQLGPITGTAIEVLARITGASS